MDLKEAWEILRSCINTSQDMREEAAFHIVEAKILQTANSAINAISINDEFDKIKSALDQIGISIAVIKLETAL